MNDPALIVAVFSLVVSFVSAALGAYTAIKTIAESNKARDMATLEAIRASVRETSIDLFQTIRDDNTNAIEHDFYASQFLDTLEYASHIYLERMLTKAPQKFIGEWLETEINDLVNIDWILASVVPKKLNDGNYSNIRAVAKRLKIDLFKKNV
ncbi:MULTISPECIES: hypothetical protein [unclassified Rhizobium]|uniref:hypothetical protein n=1 Tax=unclassified Rhizobium TaxID=2613769 RepID=UPI00288C2003|nr:MULTISPECIES: hypothetical protein [unclassified Rhizobium]